MISDETVYLCVRLPRKTRNLFNSEAKLEGKSQGEFIKLLLEYYKKKSLPKPQTNIFGRRLE